MGDLDEKSTLNKRNLGLTNRIWLILALFLSLLAFTSYILPSSAYRSTPYVPPNAKPVNYLNTTENPFAFCPLYGPGDVLGKKYGTLSLEQTRLHHGSGARVQRVIQKALAGQPVTISVLGGSGQCSVLSRYIH
jgi:hypothetical protein